MSDQAIITDYKALRETLELDFYRLVGEAGIRESNAKAEAHEQIAAQQKNIAEQESFKAAVWGLEWEMKRLALESQRDAVQRAKQLKRPCMTLGIQVRSEERDLRTVYIAQWSGLIAEGDTPEMACAEFDRMWVGGNDEL